MGPSLRPLVIVVELAILMALIYSLFSAFRLAAFDFGLGQKFNPFIKWVFMIMGCLALIFFAAHLITFYPRLSHF